MIEPPTLRLQLHPVTPSQGLVWLRRAFTLFFRHPLAFCSLFVLFLLAVLLVVQLPYFGAPLTMMSLPLLSLGFMIATRSAARGGPVSPAQFLEPLRYAGPRRRALIQLCLMYALATLAIMLLSDWVDGGRFEQLQVEAVKPAGEPGLVVLDGPLLWGLAVRFGLATLLAVPFWHAPALVWWGAQGPAQAMFSSTLACWRTRGALLTYSIAWAGLVMAFALLAALLFGLIGAHQMAGLAALPAALMFSTVFYVSLYFTFADTFGVDTQAADPVP
jgi:hypothetical protein